MAGKKEYSPEFKRKVAREALDQNRENMDRLSEKHDVPVSLILTWAVELEKNGPDAFREERAETAPEPEDDETMEVDITNEKVADSVGEGVMLDQLNYKRLIFWSVLGMILAVIFVQALVELYQYDTQMTRERVSGSSEYYQINELEEQAQERLENFGVVDPDSGIYHIPIDSAMNQMVRENN